MKHNPRANEAAAAVPGFAGLHPLQTEDQAQGALRVMHEVQGFLAEISGLPASPCSRWPARRASSTSILMIRKYFEDAGDHGRTTVIVPETAHGTNPATASMAELQSRRGRARRARLRGRGRVARDGGRDDGRAHDHQPQHLRRLRAEHKGDSGGPARGRRLPLHGRREHERQHGPHARRRRRRGHHALQSAQDLLHPPRRRRSRLGAIACSEDLAPFLPDPVVEKQDDEYTLRPAREEHRSGGCLPRQLRPGAAAPGTTSGCTGPTSRT